MGRRWLERESSLSAGPGIWVPKRGDWLVVPLHLGRSGSGRRKAQEQDSAPPARAPRGYLRLPAGSLRIFTGKLSSFGCTGTSQRPLPIKRVLLLRCTPRNAGLAEQWRACLEGQEAAAGEGGPGGPRWSPVVPVGECEGGGGQCPLPDSPRSVHVPCLLPGFTMTAGTVLGAQGTGGERVVPSGRPRSGRRPFPVRLFTLQWKFLE